ncbi:hypothetical protein ACTHPH_22735 [Paenibacillus pasadenensis]|uniref:Spore coat protein n=1 Tax=Paenibacillus pasadenensis TaxID=217090 RepID=A0A2N5N440_9BACL|nr:MULTISPECIES: hypothetical protein [Paenibacillus]PLT45093.1 hypothetical protein B8V81_3524 [Paenibacillus pasadenensis]QGG55502.1 hypothetical protein GE073_07950 [Paenibacillus sp. B01]
MQPITGKEMEYIADSMSNEDLLAKQCACAATSISVPGVSQVLSGMASAHQQNYAMLLSTLQQHQQLAPTSPQTN